MKGTLLFGLLLVAGLFIFGACGSDSNACEDLADDYKSACCEVAPEGSVCKPPETTTDTSSDTEAECTDAAETAAQKVLDDLNAADDATKKLMCGDTSGAEGEGEGEGEGE